MATYFTWPYLFQSAILTWLIHNEMERLSTQMALCKGNHFYPVAFQAEGVLSLPASVRVRLSVRKKFNYTRRFIDDLHTLNNDGHLEENNNMGRIYPQELKLNQENKNDDKATFLDLEEQIKDACIEVKTYDKRDAFKFEIINYPDLSGNIPTKPAYGVFTSQVIRYARICSKKVDLLERVKSLTKKLLRKHYTISGLKSSLKICLKKHRWITTKLGPRLHQNLTEE